MLETEKIRRICSSVVQKMNFYISEQGLPRTEEHAFALILNFMQPLRLHVGHHVYKFFKPRWLSIRLTEEGLQKLSFFSCEDTAFESCRLINRFLEEAISNSPKVEDTRVKTLEGFNKHIKNLSNFKFQ
jgi:hypothetical protein